MQEATAAAAAASFTLLLLLLLLALKLYPFLVKFLIAIKLESTFLVSLKLIEGQQEKRTCDQLIQSMLKGSRLMEVCASVAASGLHLVTVETLMYDFTTVWIGKCAISVPILMHQRAM